MLAAALLSGCTNAGFVAERAVDNPIPPLKTGVFSVTGVDVRPVATREVEPDYPPELGSILTGTATVVFTVRANGKVADASVVTADDVLFGEAAVAAVSKWRFHPAEVKGAPVDCRMTLPFAFTSPYGYLPGEGAVADPLPGAPPDYSHKSAIESHPN